MEAKQLLMECIRDESGKVSPRLHYPSMPTYLKGVKVSPDEEKSMQVSKGKALFPVTGMTSSACGGSVEKAVERLPAIDKAVVDCPAFVNVNSKSIIDLPDDMILTIGKKIPIDLCAQFQTINSDWRRALEPIVRPERLRRAAHREIRESAQLIADLMNDDQTYGLALAARFTMESNQSIVPFHKAGMVLGKLTKNKNINRERREYFLKLAIPKSSMESMN